MIWEGQEKRKFPRVVFSCKTVVVYPIRWLASHAEDITHAENISAGGIKVILEERLSVLTSVSLELFFEKHSSTRCRGRVVWVEEKVNPTEIQSKTIVFDTGIEFTDIHDYDREYIRRLVKLLSLLEKKDDFSKSALPSKP